jgi:amidase
VKKVDPVSADATELADGVRSRDFSARRLIEATLQRINDLEPSINALRTVMATEALLDADRIDSLPDAELAELPLAGVPVAIMDDTDVAGQSTMWGTAIDRGVCDQDADIVDRLRRAGAIIVGKTNVPELTLWPWTASASWGVTRNPWDTERTPGGSSGGSAAAVCTGMAAMALGSDGGGSVRYPAGLTGLVGVKPERDRVPIGPEHGSGWHGLIALGPLTRSVRDAALFLDVVSHKNATSELRDLLTKPAPEMRIAVSTNPPPGSQVSLSADRRRTIDKTAELLSSLGHQVIEVDIDYDLAALWNSTVRLLKGVQDDVASLPDDRRLEARTRRVARLGRLIHSRSLRRALDNEQRITDSISEVFDDADVVVTPLCAGAAPPIDQCPSRGVIRSLRAANTSAWLVPWNLNGQPAITIPTGLHHDGLPTAVQLAGQPDGLGKLLGLCSQIETTQPFPRWSTTQLTDG